MKNQIVGDVDALVAAYVTGTGMAAAAEAANMSTRTAWRRLQTPEVQELVRQVRAERRSSLIEWSQSIRGLADLVTDAVVVLLDDDPTPATVCRLAATVLPEVRHLADSVDVAARLDHLEAMMSGDDGNELAKVVAL